MPFNYYGSRERHNDPRHGCRILLDDGTPDGGYCDFTSPAVADRFLDQHCSLMRLMRTINDDIDHHEQIDDRLLNEWIPLTESFTERWGSSMVPVDLRGAINDIRENLKLSVVVWPPRMFCGPIGLYTMDMSPVSVSSIDFK